jgi:hypothetical protein
MQQEGSKKVEETNENKKPKAVPLLPDRCSYSFLTSATDGVSGQRHAPAAVPNGQEAGASELGWAQRLQQKLFASARDRTPVVQSFSSQSIKIFGVKIYS